MPTIALKERSLKFRATPDQDARLRAAANLAREDLTTFILTPALRRADEILGTSEVIELPENDYHAMLATLLDPPRKLDGLATLASKNRQLAL